jgi:hypothetical protein
MSWHCSTGAIDDALFPGLADEALVHCLMADAFFIENVD